MCLTSDASIAAQMIMTSSLPEMTDRLLIQTIFAAAAVSGRYRGLWSFMAVYEPVYGCVTYAARLD